MNKNLSKIIKLSTILFVFGFLFFGNLNEAQAAISFVTSSACESSDDGVGSYILTLPTTQEGDLVIISVGVVDDDVADSDVGPNLVGTYGYTEVADLYANDTRQTNFGVFWKFMGATPDTSYTLDSIAGNDASNVAVCMVFRGVNTTTPMDVTSTTATNINTMHPNPPSINHNNPSGVWTVIAGVAGHVLNAGTFTFPTGYTTNANDRTHNDTNDATVGMGYRSSGVSDPEDPGVMTHSGTDATTASWAAVTMALRPAVYTTLGDGTDGASSTIGPGDPATEIDRFSLVTSSGTDTVTGLTVTLGGDVSAYTNIASVLVETQLGGPLCSALNPSSNTVPLVSCGINVTTTPTDYVVKITPKTHANMPGPLTGAIYATTATVTSITATNQTAGVDTLAGTPVITVDNASPGNVSSATAADGVGEVDLAWTNSGETDLSQVIVLRHTSAVSDTPVEGASYSVGNAIGSATVACVEVASFGSLGSCTDTNVTPGTPYHYKIYSKDSRGNYSFGGTVPTGSPVTPTSPPNRYWVGGTASWDGTAGTKWSYTSGGAGGAPIPTSTDNAIFDGNSGSGTVTLAAGHTNVKNLDFTGFTGTWAGAVYDFNVYGNLTLGASMNITFSGFLSISDNVTHTITSNGKTLPAGVIQINNGTVELADALSVSGNINLQNGTFTTNNHNVTIAEINMGIYNTKVMNLGSSTINLTGLSRCIYIPEQQPGATVNFNAGTSTINCNGDNFVDVVTDTGVTFYDFNMIGGTISSASNTFHNLTITGSATKTDSLTLYANQVITGTLTINGNSAINRILVKSDTLGTSRTLTAAAVSLSNVDFTDITGAGAASPFTGTSLGDALGNSGITFTTPTTRYWVGGTGSWSSTGEWSTSSGGGSGASVPLPQDTVIFNANSFSGASQVVSGDMPRLGKDITFTGVTNNPDFSPNGNTMYGSLTLASGMTAGGNTFTMAPRSPATITTAGVSIGSGAFNINAFGTTVTLQDNFTNTNCNGVNLNYGTFNANNFNVTACRFNSVVSDTRTINMGNGIWTMTGTANGSGPWYMLSTGLTLNAGLSTIKFTDTSNGRANFTGAGKTYNNVWFSRGTSIGINEISDSNTFADFKDDGTAAHSILFAAGATQTMTSFTANSATVGNLLTINSGNGGGSTSTSTHALTLTGGGTVSSDYLNIQHSVASPASTWYAGVNSTNNQGVADAGSGWIFTAPPSTTAGTTGTQTASLAKNTTNNHIGGAFTFTPNTNLNVTSITITESGTINGSTNLDNIKLYYENDTSAPYNCASESYGGGESQYGSTDTDGFSGANGTSTFTATVGVTTTSTLCIYPVLDVTSGATGGETIEISIATTGDFNTSVGIKTGTPAIAGTTTIANQTILGDGTDGGNSTVGPGASPTEIDRFSLATDVSTDIVTGLTVTLDGNASAYTNIATVGVYTTGDVLKCSSSSWGSDNLVELTSCAIDVTTTPTDYVVKITPKVHGDMPAVPGASYATTATVTALTMTNALTGTDTDSAIITVDNASPAGVTSSTAADGVDQVNLAWTNPADSDFTEVVILRRATSDVADVPAEGSTYSVGNTIGTATVVCVTASTSCTDTTSLVPGTAYYYKIFTKDSRGNYSASVSPTGSPVTPTTNRRYWVGGTASWDGTAGTKWALCSGCAGGASIPSSTLDAYFDAASGAVTVTIASGNTGARNVNFTGFTGTLAGSTALSVYGDWTFGSGMTNSYTGTVTFAATSGTKTITSNGKTFGSLASINFNGVGGTWQLADALSVGFAANYGTITLTNGVLNTNNQSVIAATFNIAAGTKTLTLGSSNVTLSNWGSSLNTTNLTFNANTSTITMNNGTCTPSFSGGGLTYNNVIMSGYCNTNNPGTMTGANTFANLTFSGAAGGQSISANQTITGTLTMTGNAANDRLFVRSSTLGTAYTLNAAAVTASHVDLADITGAGAASWNLSGITGGSGNCLGNSGITFTSPTNRYWVAAGTASWNATSSWSASSGGGSGASVPLCHDNVIFDGNSGSGTRTVSANMPRLGADISFANISAGAVTWTNTALNTIYGSLTLASNVTPSGTNQTTFSPRSSKTLTSAGRTFTQGITIDAPGGGITLQDHFVTSRNNPSAINLNTGTFDANNFNVSITGTLASFTSIGTNTRTLNLGSGTWTLTARQPAVWQVQSTGLTLNAGTSTLIFNETTNNPISFYGGGMTYNNVWFNRAGSTSYIQIVGSNTFNDFKDTGTAAHTLYFDDGTTQTMNSFTVSGSLGNLITIDSSNGSGSPSTSTHALTIAGGGFVDVDYLNIQHSVASPANTWYAGTGSTNNQGVATIGSGWLFSVAPDCFLDTTGNWSTASNWSFCGTGGVPLAGENVTITAAKTVTLDVATPVLNTLTISGTLDTSATNYALNATTLNIDSTGTLDANDSTITLSGTTGTLFTKHASGTFTNGNSTLVLSGNGDATINSGTVVFHNLTSSGTGTKTLGGNTTVEGDFNLNAGTFELSSYDFDISSTTGVTSISGTFSDANVTGTNTFSGDVTINSGGIWATTNDPAFTFEGSLTNDSSSGFTSGAGVYTFNSTDAENISGSQAFTITNLTNDIDNSTGLTFSGAQPTVTTLTQGTGAVLTFSGVVPSITTLTATASGNTVNYTGSGQTLAGVNTWTQVGNNSATITGSNPAVAGLTDSRVAYIDAVNDSLRAYDFNGTDWSQVGSSLSVSNAGFLAIGTLSPTTIAFFDTGNDILRAYTFNGSTWSQTGNSLSLGATGFASMAVMSSSRIAFIDSDNEQLRAYDFNGSTWSLVGTGFNIAGTNFSALARLSDSRIALVDSDLDTLRTYDFNGSAWSQVGNSLSVTQGSPGMAAMSSTRVALVESDDLLRVYDFNGTDWSQVGSSFGISNVGNPSLSAMTSGRFVFTDSVNDQIRAYEFAGPTYHNLTTSSSGTKTLMGYTKVNNNLELAAGTLEVASHGLVVTGTSSIAGTLSDTSVSGTNLFIGGVTINSGGVWSTTNNPGFTFRNGLTNNSSSGFTSGSGAYTFNTNAQTVSGSQVFTIANIVNDVTSSTGLTFSGAQPTVGTLTQGINSILTFSGAIPSITLLDSDVSPNTVRYVGNSQTIITSSSPQTHSLDLESQSVQYASIEDVSQTGLDLTGDFTIEGWVRLESLPNASSRLVLASKWNQTGNQRSYRLGIFNNAGTYQVELGVSSDGTNVVVGTVDYAFTTNVWYHLAVAYNTSEALYDVYINGEYIGGAGEMPTSIFSGTGLFAVGTANITSNPFDGLIKDLRVFNDVRTESEIEEDMIKQYVSDLNLVGEWNFNNNYLDNTNNNNDLTSTNSPVFSNTIPTYLDTQVYHDLLVGVSGTATLDGVLDVNDDLTISSGTLDTANYGITIGGNYSNSGIFSAGTSSTVTFKAGDTDNILTGAMTGSSKFNTVVFDNVDGAWSFGANSVDVGKDFIIVAGEVTAPSTTLKISGNFSNTPETAESFVHNSGKVEFITSNKASIVGSTTFNDVTIAAGGKKVEFGAGDTFTTNGLLTLTGPSYDSMVILDSNGKNNSQWFINHQGTESISFVELSNAGCNAASTDINMGVTSVDASHNDKDCWIFPVVNRGSGGGGNAGGESSGAPGQTQTGGGQGGGGGNSGGENGGQPSGAAATATVSNNVVTGVNITSGGSNYSSPPTVTFCGGGGSNAAGTASVSGGAVTGVEVTNGGSGYTGVPIVQFNQACSPGSSGGGGGGDSGFLFDNVRFLALVFNAFTNLIL